MARLTAKINLSENKADIELLPHAKKTPIDSISFLYYHRLGESRRASNNPGLKEKDQLQGDSVSVYASLLLGLITGLDKLVHRNTIDSIDIDSVYLVSSLGPDSTSYKIGRSFAEGISIKAK